MDNCLPETTEEKMTEDMTEDIWVQRALYDGALLVDLPDALIDSSDIRGVPDHQEVFLSRRSLTSIIFEINQYQNPEDVSSSNSTSNSTSTTIEHDTLDIAAAAYHLNDIISELDHLDDNGISSEKVVMGSDSLAKYPAYSSTATIIVSEVGLSTVIMLPSAWESDPTKRNFQTKVQQLLVRMQDHGTDLVVRIHTPLKEYEGVIPQPDNVFDAEAEYQWSQQVMQEIIATLEVQNFGLFGEKD